jgi:pimeloyl-ACP methyl ester carboxylesterase
MSIPVLPQRSNDGRCGRRLHEATPAIAMPAPPLLLILAALLLLQPLALAIPAEPHFFQQLVDHFAADERTYQQRYYINDTAFAGAGSPIFMIMGGEGGIEPSTGIFYPSIVLLAQRLGGLVVQPEHRFYGSSQPLQPYCTQTLELLTSAQALADAAALLTSLRQQLKCSGLNGEPRCPAVTVGGSYPGFLAAMMRMRYPNVVDMAYAASAPLRFYSQVQPPPDSPPHPHHPVAGRRPVPLLFSRHCQCGACCARLPRCCAPRLG